MSAASDTGKYNIYLVGFSGTGKSHSGRIAASLIGLEFVDMDDLVERRAGKSIPRIFDEDGEQAFRDIESAVLEELAGGGGKVISTGGGTPIREKNRQLMKASGLAIRLRATPETIHSRLARGEGTRNRTLRPLLGSEAPIERVRQLLDERETAYAAADVTIDTDGRMPRDVARDIASSWRNWVETLHSSQGPADSNLAATVHTSQGDYNVVVGRGVIGTIGGELHAAGLKGRAYIVSDEALFPSGVRGCQEALEAAGFPANVLTVPSGEHSKSLDMARRVYDWLAGQRAERRDFIVAVGGGVTGDLAGFVASTWLRGVPFVQVPTSLASMVDASIGGKVAVNLPVGKNLVGAFHQPKLVLAEIEYLATLPRREMASGWAEAIKHGLILDAALLDRFERNADEMLSLSGELAVQAIRRSVAIKAEVVSEDEFETGERRVLLNYGHTVGHALEAVTEYGRFLHGEAVSVGMMVAAGISQRLGMISQELVDRQRAVLERFGLPTRAVGISVDAVLAATKSDKKSRGGSIRWVLLEGPGKATTRQDVPDGVVREAVTQALAG